MTGLSVTQGKRRVGLLAGGGQFPVEFARAAANAGHEVVCLGIAGMAPPVLADVCHSFRAVPLARIGLAIRHFKRHRVARAVMAGKIEKRILFDPLRVLRLMPDLRTLHMWYVYARENRK